MAKKKATDTPLSTVEKERKRYLHGLVNLIVLADKFQEFGDFSQTDKALKELDSYAKKSMKKRVNAAQTFLRKLALGIKDAEII